MVPPPPKEEPWAPSQEAWVWILVLKTMRHVTSGSSRPGRFARARSALRVPSGSPCILLFLLIFLFREGKW